MKKVIESFQVEYLQILDEDGNVDQELLKELKLSNATNKKMYEFMVLTKKFDEAALSLQREGRLGTYAVVRGQEAAQVGSALVLRKEDWMFPAFRENAAFIVRGMPMHMILQYWGGDERGEQIPKNLNNFTISIKKTKNCNFSLFWRWCHK